MIKSILVILLLIALTAGANAASWSGSVKTDTDSWYIYRQSTNLSFDFAQKIDGTISPVEGPGGRILSPFSATYENMRFNDVRFKERIGALEGSYKSESRMSLRSSINNSVNATIVKPAGTDVYAIDFYEKWPVKISAVKSLEYSGREINDWEFNGNNHDFVATNFLYNKQLSKERALNMSLERLNASLLATDQAIELAEVMATRDTDYRLTAHTTGIADIKYRQVGTEAEIQNEGDERFVGVYDITKHIRMKSRFDKHLTEDDWLPCCSGGWTDMRYYDQKGFGASARGIFDCKCYKVPAQAQFQS